MKFISSFTSFIIQHSFLVIIGLIAYFIALVTINFALSVPMLLLAIVGPLVFFILLGYPKALVYFVIPYWPFAFIINRFFAFLPGGSKYLSVNLMGVVLVAGTVLGIVTLFKERANVFKNQLTVPMMIFFVTVIIGIIMSPLHFWAFRWLFRYGLPAVIYLLILQKFNFKEAKRLLNLFFNSFIFVILYGYWMLATQSEKMGMYQPLASGENIYRLGGVEGGAGFHPNTLGLFFAVYIMLTMFLYYESQKKYKWVYVFFLMNMIFLLFNTYSRLGWVCFMAGMSVIGLLRGHKFFFVFLLIGVFILTAVPFVSNRIEQRFAERGAIKSRFKHYEHSFELILKKPVFGGGMGAFQLATSARLNLSQKSKQEYGIGGAQPHNEYLRILVELGIVGLLIFFYLMYRFLRLAMLLFRSHHPTVKNYGVFLLALMAVSLLSGIPGHGFQSSGFFLWIFAAIGEVYLRELESPAPESAGIQLI